MVNKILSFLDYQVGLYYNQGRCVDKKSKCVAAKGRLQGWAATLLLLCGGLFQ